MVNDLEEITQKEFSKRMKEKTKALEDKINQIFLKIKSNKENGKKTD